MKIYTKTGDDGTTSLIGGQRVAKNHPRVEAYGTTDELISYLGVIIAESESQVHSSLVRIQKTLMLIAAHFADAQDVKDLKPIDSAEIQFLEDEIDKMTAELPELHSFVLPGAPVQAAECQFARTLCRRAERRAVEFASPEDRHYLNRLSDYLFTLGRYCCLVAHIPEELW